MEEVNLLIAFIEKMSLIFAPLAYISALLATISITLALLSQKGKQFKFAMNCFFTSATVAIIFYILSKVFTN